MREYDINPGSLDMSESILQDRDVPHISQSEFFEDQSGEGFHVNSSWTFPSSHAVSVEEIRVFQACLVVKRWTGGMF